MLKLCQNNEEKMVPHESTAKQVSLKRQQSGHGRRIQMLLYVLSINPYQTSVKWDLFICNILICTYKPIRIVLGNQKKTLPTFSNLFFFAPLNQDLKFSNNHVNHVRTWNVVEANS